MSVYTSVSDSEFSEILKNYSLGEFICSQGIQAGIENTNYFVVTTKGEFVFTLFEKINQQELAFYISLLQELYLSGIACPQPQIDINNQTINIIKEKPFTIVSKLNGNNLTSVNHNQCNAIASQLAKLHTSTSSLSISDTSLLQNRRGQLWRDKAADRLLPQLSNYEVELLSNEIDHYRSFDDTKLPKGIIHADLFKDNALFENDQLTGIIDFYDACYGSYLYDIAITVNAWCTNIGGKLNQDLVSTFLHSYQSIRMLTHAEKQAWPLILRMAATRFWLSRLEDSITPNVPSSKQGTLTHSKDPMEYRLILESHIESDNSLLSSV